MQKHTLTLSWSADSDQGHYLCHLADGSEVKVMDPENDQQEFMEPEEAFLAALSSCHMLSFLTEAAKEGYSVARYQDNPVAALGQDSQALIYVNAVTLSPQVSFQGEAQPEPAQIQALHQKAHKKCFIARSVKSDISIEPRE